MANFIARMFTPPKKQEQQQAPSAPKPTLKKKEDEVVRPKARTQTKYAGAALGAQYKKDEAGAAKKMLLGQ